MATSWTGPTFKGRAHGPGPRSWTGPKHEGRSRRRSRGSPAGSPSRVHESTAHRPRAGPARPSRAAASPGPGSPSRAHGRRRARLTGGLTGSRADPDVELMTGSPSRAGLTVQPSKLDRLTGSRRAGLTGGLTRARLTAHGHGLDRPDLQGPGSPAGSREHGSRAHGPGLTRARLTGPVQALEAGPAHGLTGSRSRAHESTAHGGPGSPSKPSKLDRLTVQALEAREPGRAPSNGPGLTRARLTAGSRAGPARPSWAGLTVQGSPSG